MAEGPAKPRKRRVAFAAGAVRGLALIAFCGYLAVYLLASEVLYSHMAGVRPGHPVPRPDHVIREWYLPYDLSPIPVRVFVPLAWLEAKLTRRTVMIRGFPVTSGWATEFVFEP
jgi:hypothetical protein